MAKSGCQKISEMADRLEERNIKRCPTRYKLHKAEQRRKRVEKVKRGVVKTGKVVGQIFGTGRTVFAELDRRLGSDVKPRRRTPRRKTTKRRR